MSVIQPANLSFGTNKYLRNGEEHPRAYCVKAEGTHLSEDGVAKWLETKVSRNKRLTGGVKFVDVISKNPV